MASRLPLRAAASLQTPSPTSFRALARSWAGRLFLISAIVRAAAWLMQRVPAVAMVGTALGVLGSIGLLVAFGYLLYRAVGIIRHDFLWRVRQKLVVSYLFIGFVPALLLVAFFTLAGLLMFRYFSSYVFKTSFDDLVEQVRVQADTAALEIQRGAGLVPARAVLERKAANLARRYPGISFALVVVPPASAPTDSAPAAAARKAAGAASEGTPLHAEAMALAVGPWEHLDAPKTLPPWVGREGFGGAISYKDDSTAEVALVLRAVGLPETPSPTFAVIADLPFDVVRERLNEGTGLRIGSSDVNGDLRERIGLAKESSEGTPTQSDNWVATFKAWDWTTGAEGQGSIALRVRASDIFARLSEIQPRLPNGTDVARASFAVLGMLVALFLIIEFVALLMGGALARSITGSVHELFEGTERVRQGDLGHRIVVTTRDQLGALAESFNSMTASIEDLLQQAAEKRRLEEELRIARQIQMSLLPRGALIMPGLTVASLCVPAREVGGDYYDFFPLGEHRVGLLIADVSGKGTSAALYMAELKGLMLSLSQIHHSPRQLLKAVNHIISENLDSRSFITMSYAVFDLEARTLVYARAGHTPLIYVPASGRPRAQVLTPDGMVVGLRLPGIDEKFDLHTTESTLAIGDGDIFVFFTDGITEAMNPDEDLFGEMRLAKIIEEHRDLSCEELRERVLREVEAFVGAADQHDDMTMILLKIDQVADPRVHEDEAALAVAD